MTAPTGGTWTANNWAASAPQTRPRIPRWLLLVGALVALAAGGVEFAHNHNPVEAVEAVVAAGLGVAVAALAWSLPGVTRRGLVLGAFFTLGGMLSWSYMDRPIVIWALLGVGGLLFLWWGWPWLDGLRALPRLGAAWLGLGYWLIGVLGALLQPHLGVAGQRVAYAGVFGLAALAVVASVRRRRGADPTAGIVAAFLYAVAALLISGSGNLFDARHTVPAGGWGTNMRGRFWGGEHLLYHPNSLALIAVLIAVRIGMDKAFTVAQRVSALALMGVLVYVTNSRSGVVFGAAVALVHAVLLWWRPRRPADLPGYHRRARVVATLAPFAVIALVTLLSMLNGTFLGQNRYSDGGVTSGRTQTWQAVFHEFRTDDWVQKAFGDTDNARAEVYRPSAPTTGLTTDNAAVGALRRAGVAGEVAFVGGLVLLLWHALPRRRRTPGRGAPTKRGAPRPAGWLTTVAFGAVPTIAFSDWLLGGTGGTLWVLLLAGEAWLLHGAGRGRLSATAGTAEAAAGSPPHPAAGADPRPAAGTDPAPTGTAH